MGGRCSACCRSHVKQVEVHALAGARPEKQVDVQSRSARTSCFHGITLDTGGQSGNFHRPEGATGVEMAEESVDVSPFSPFPATATGHGAKLCNRESAG